MPRKCSICNHDRRREVEHALLRGESHRAVAQRFTVSRGAVASHLREVEGGKSILLQLRELNLQAEQLKAKADRTGDYRTALAALREKTRLVELEARLTGELNEKPEVKIVNLSLDTETARRLTETFLARHKERPHHA